MYLDYVWTVHGAEFLTSHVILIQTLWSIRNKRTKGIFIQKWSGWIYPWSLTFSSVGICRNNHSEHLVPPHKVLSWCTVLNVTEEKILFSQTPTPLCECKWNTVFYLDGDFTSREQLIMGGSIPCFTFWGWGKKNNCKESTVTYHWMSLVNLLFDLYNHHLINTIKYH